MIRFFSHSAGALLLAASLVVFFSVWGGSGLTQPHEPLSRMSMPEWFCIVGGLELAVGLACIFGKKPKIQMAMIFWLAINFAVYQAAIWCLNGSFGFGGYLVEVSTAFGISTCTADFIFKALTLYLLAGSSFFLAWFRTGENIGDIPGNGPDEFMTACHFCGGHIRFPTKYVGQHILCPHCQNGTTLRDPGYIKMPCYFCKEHIEFPSHAIGHKMRCPHCKMDITLKEPA